MTLEEVFECIVNRTPVDYNGIICIPVGYGVRRIKTGKFVRQIQLIEENAKVDITHIVLRPDELKPASGTIYKKTDIEHTLTVSDLKAIDSVVRMVHNKERYRKITEAYNV